MVTDGNYIYGTTFHDVHKCQITMFTSKTNIALYVSYTKTKKKK